MNLVKADCWFVSKTSPVVQRKMTALYWARLTSVNKAASSVASTVKLFVAANCWMAVMPSGMEVWRNSAVLEKISALKEGVCAWVPAIPDSSRPAKNNGVSFNVGIITDWAGVVTWSFGAFGRNKRTKGGECLALDVEG